MGKFIIEDSEKKRILSLHKKLINEELNNDKEDVVLTYTSLKRKGSTNEVYFNTIKLKFQGTLYVKYLDISNIINELYSSGRLGNIILKIQEDWIDNPKGLKGFSGEISDYITNYKDITLTSGFENYTSVLVKIDDRIKRLRPYTKMIEIEKSKGININEPVIELTPEIIDVVNKPISDRDVINELNKTIKESIASIYKNGNTWSYTRDGVINMYTLEEYGIENDNWSVLNYFNSAATPKRIKELFIKNTNINPGESQESLDKLKGWIIKHKYSLFTDKGGRVFENLIDPQVGALRQGKYNEVKAYNFIDKLLENPNTPSIINTLSEKFAGYKLLPQEKAGSKLDRSGVDMTLVNNSGDKIYIQAKPNTSVDRIKNSDGTTSYLIKSSSVYNLDRIPKTKYFIFVSDLEWKDRENKDIPDDEKKSDKRGVICFENRKGQFSINKDGHHIKFNYPPVFWDPNY